MPGGRSTLLDAERAEGEIDLNRVISMLLDGVHPHDVATIFDHEGVAVRAGHHCAMPVMLRYDIPATTRASFYVYNDLDDVEALSSAVRAAQTVFGVGH